VARDVARGYYTRDQARERFSVVIGDDGAVDEQATGALRRNALPPCGSGAVHQDEAHT
jgi:hypothetical protein